MSTKNLRVAVVGGGVCGLTCAITLQREGVDVDVYEAAVEWASCIRDWCTTDLSSGAGQVR